MTALAIYSLHFDYARRRPFDWGLNDNVIHNFYEGGIKAIGAVGSGWEARFQFSANDNGEAIIAKWQAGPFLPPSKFAIYALWWA